MECSGKAVHGWQDTATIRMTLVASDYGYRDGSGVHRVVQRLDERAKVDAALARRLKALAEEESSVKS